MTRHVILIVGAVLLLAGCGLASPGRVPVIDGWPVGAEKTCALDDSRCLALIPTAIDGFRRFHADEAAVVRVTLHNEGPMVDAQGNVVLMTRSGGCCSVALFELADGTFRAIGVGFPGVAQEPMAFETGP